MTECKYCGDPHASCPDWGEAFECAQNIYPVTDESAPRFVRILRSIADEIDPKEKDH